MKKLLVLLFSFLFLVSPYISANEQLIGSWENDKGLRMDILAGFKANVGPVIYWENEEASKVFKWQVNPNNNDLKISYSTRGYSLLENGNLRWGNDIFQKLNNIERKNVIDLKNDPDAFINALTVSEWSSDSRKSDTKEFTKTFSSTSGIFSEFDSNNEFTGLSTWGVSSGVLKIGSSKIYVESIISDKYFIAVDAQDRFFVLTKGDVKKVYERISLADSREQFLSSLTSGAWIKKNYSTDSIYRFRPIEGELKGRVFEERDNKLVSSRVWEYSPATGVFKQSSEYPSALNIGDLLVFIDKNGKQNAFYRDKTVELSSFSHNDVINIPISERSTEEIKNTLTKQMSVGTGSEFTLFEFNKDNRTGYFHEWESYPFQITGQTLKIDGLYSKIEQLYLIEDYVVFDERFSKKIDTRESRMKPKSDEEASEDSVQAKAKLEAEVKSAINIKIELIDGTSELIPVPINSISDLKSISIINK